MDVFGLIMWLAGLVYFTLCIGIPKIRMYHRHIDKKVGLVTCIGAAMFFWIPTLIFVGAAFGVLDEEHLQSWFLLVILAVVVVFAGFVIDKHE